MAWHTDIPSSGSHLVGGCYRIPFRLPQLPHGQLALCLGAVRWRLQETWALAGGEHSHGFTV